MNSAQHLLHQVSYPLFLRAYYLKYLLSELRKDEYCRRQLGIRRFVDLDLRTVKRSNTLFILASGSSINKISPAGWDAIARFDSIGFNFWPIHPFVPNMYFLETIPTNWPQMFEALCRIARRRAQISSVFKQASTLSSLIALAIRMQYRTIVLCGVDLNHQLE